MSADSVTAAPVLLVEAPCSGQMLADLIVFAQDRWGDVDVSLFDDEWFRLSAADPSPARDRTAAVPAAAPPAAPAEPGVTGAPEDPDVTDRLTAPLVAGNPRLTRMAVAAWLLEHGSGSALAIAEGTDLPVEDVRDALRHLTEVGKTASAGNAGWKPTKQFNADAARARAAEGL